MESIAVESSAIKSYAYDANEKILELVYIGGGRYRYYDVPPEVVAGIETAPSIGRYVNAHIVDAFRFDPIP